MSPTFRIGERVCSGSIVYVDDSSGQRQMFNRNQQNGYNRMDTIRSETENLVPVQDVVTDPSSIKLVKAFREEQMADVKDEDRQPSVVNNKIVYVVLQLFVDCRV